MNVHRIPPRRCLAHNSSSCQCQRAPPPLNFASVWLAKPSPSISARAELPAPTAVRSAFGCLPVFSRKPSLFMIRYMSFSARSLVPMSVGFSRPGVLVASCVANDVVTTAALQCAAVCCNSHNSFIAKVSRHRLHANSDTGTFDIANILGFTRRQSRCRLCGSLAS